MVRREASKGIQLLVGRFNVKSRLGSIWHTPSQARLKSGQSQPDRDRQDRTAGRWKISKSSNTTQNKIQRFLIQVLEIERIQVPSLASNNLAIKPALLQGGETKRAVEDIRFISSPFNTLRYSPSSRFWVLYPPSIASGGIAVLLLLRFIPTSYPT